jgi:hypothetical protein
MQAALRYLRAELVWLADARFKLCREVGRQETPLRAAYDQLQQLEREIAEVEDAVSLIETVLAMDDDGMRQGRLVLEAAE